MIYNIVNGYLITEEGSRAISIRKITEIRVEKIFKQPVERYGAPMVATGEWQIGVRVQDDSTPDSFFGIYASQQDAKNALLKLVTEISQNGT